MSIGADAILAPLCAGALFLFWGVVGYAVLSSLPAGLERGRQLLVAPAVGTAVCLLPIFWVNWVGVPVRHFAWPLFAALVAIAVVTLWRRRPGVAGGDLWAAALPLAAAFVLNGWPLVTNGFAWLSYTNDDMATYCLMANRLLDHGLVEPPSAAVIASGSDLSANMWLFEVAFGRPGSHLVLAWVASLLAKSVVELYMPTLIAMHLVLVAAAGAVVWRQPEQRRVAFATSWLLAASALTALGTVSQLLPQLFGLSLACALLVLMWDIDRPPVGAARAVLSALIAASLLLTYPEFAPFVAIPLLVRLTALQLWRRERQQSRWVVEASVAISLLCVAPYADRLVAFLVGQSAEGLDSAARSDLFPYLRLSTTFANVWGLLPLARGGPEPWLSIAIVAGALAFAALAIALVRPLVAGDAPPAMLLFMLVFAGFLFARGNGFGLFKIAMYAQPFMLGTVALVLLAPLQSHSPARWRWIAVALIAALGVPTQAFYVRSSVSPDLGRTQILDQRSAMRELLALHEVRGNSLDVDLPVTPTAKLAGLFLHDVPLRFLGLRESFRPRGNPSTAPGRFRADVAALSDVVRQGAGTAREFDLRDPRQPTRSDRFHLVERRSRDGSTPATCDGVLTTAAAQSIVNRTTTGVAGGTYRLVPCRAIANHLAFVSSELGRNYYYGGTDPIGLFSLERDYFFPGRTFAGVGRYLLFEVLQPAPGFRLLFDVTASLKADGANRVPPIDVVGEERSSLDAVGRGSARLYSRPLTPQWIDGHAYVAIDLGAEGTLYPDTRRGLMLWLGRNLILDPRRIVGIARNISLVTQTEYLRLEPPAKIERFPYDLGSASLEYSGLYEDGWVAEDLRVVLKRPAGPGTLTLKGMMLPTPPPSRTIVTIDVDGVPVFSEPRDPGAFVINAPVPQAEGGRVAVRVSFSAARPLSAQDRRPASAHLDYLGVAPAWN